MAVSLLDIISFITTFQLLLLAFVIINYQKGKRFSNKILAAFMLSNAILVGNFLIFRLRILVFSDLPFIYYIGSATYFLLGPLLYLYTKSLCYQELKLKKIDLLHLSPFVLVAVFLTIQYYIRTAAIEGNSFSHVHSITLLDRIVEQGILHLQIFIYIVSTLNRCLIARLKSILE